MTGWTNIATHDDRMMTNAANSQSVHHTSFPFGGPSSYHMKFSGLRDVCPLSIKITPYKLIVFMRG